jgi:hypothetical protein
MVMKRGKLDQIIADIRNEQVDEETVRTAARRVFRNVFDAKFLPERVERIRGCADFQALIPAYLSHSLTPARVSLFEDHISRCVDCRGALREAREGELHTSVPRSAARRKKIHILPWAVAAALVAGIAIGLTGALNGLLPGQQAVRATVLSVEGTLYRVSDLGSSLVTAGMVITNADELRTAKGSRAIFRLANGARIEMGQRSDVSISNGWWRGPGVYLERGQMIVRTADQAHKRFFVRAGNTRIAVKNAIFAVDQGTKGARIAFARGSAEVERPQRTERLHAGQQLATNHRVRLTPIANEFAWSQNADYYLSLLGELTNLRKQLQAIPSPGLRFTASLAKYLPENTAMYAAIPNLGGTITEAKRIFDERLAESEVLREWWQQQPASRGDSLDRALTEISAISQYLGDEIVFAIPSTTGQRHGEPIFLAQNERAGLGEYLAQNIPAGIHIVSSSAGAPYRQRAGSQGLFVSLDHGLVVASPSLAELQRTERTIASQASGGFTHTPFYSQISQHYANGVEYLLAIDMEQMFRKSVKEAKDVPPGFENARYVVLEHRDAAGQSETRASLSFAGERHGMASWLAAPGPMGSLDFVSPDAAFAAAFVMKDPKTVVNELITSASKKDPEVAQHLSEVQNQLGVNLADDFAASFGGDITVAIDGPLLPTPAWKLAAEVYDPARLQQTVATLITDYNQLAGEKAGKLSSGSEQVNSQTFYWLRNDKFPKLTVYYAFVDGYLLAGPSEADLVQAIQNHQSGYTLPSSSKFQNEIPEDSYNNFSVVVYYNVGGTLGPIANQLKGMTPLAPEQKQSLQSMLAQSTPTLICLYGEPDKITAATKTSFLGFGLGTLMGVAQGKPVLPLIASSAEGAVSAARTQRSGNVRN